MSRKRSRQTQLRRTTGARLRPDKGRSVSSNRWLSRQLSDPYVAEARRLGYRARAAFKLIELDNQFRFLKRGARVVDLGAAPGGWTVVAVERVKPGPVVAIDLQAMAAVPGATVLEGDVTERATQDTLMDAIGGSADVVLSDMSPAATGHARTDQLRIVALADTAYAVARAVLAPGGAFVAKLFHGGAHAELLAALKRDFAKVRHAKPPASRKESPEIYLVATGFRGVPTEDAEKK